MSDINFDGDAVGFEQKAVGTAVVTLTAGSLTPSGGIRVKGAAITCETAPIRWRCDGGNAGTAAAGSGHFLGTTDAIILYGHNNLKQFTAVRSTGSDAAMQITYFS